MLLEALQSRDFHQARTLLESGEKLPSNIQDFHKTAIFDTLVREKAFDIIDRFVADGTIETDIYEYDSFDRSFFASLVKQLPDHPESLEFLNRFIPGLQSLNDELEGISLLGFALDNEAHPTVIKALIDNGCDVSGIDRAEENHFHKIVKKFTRNTDKQVAYLQMLYDEGLDLDKQNVTGDTPMHLTVSTNKDEYLKWFLENGADAYVLNKNNESVFFLATAQGGGPGKYKILREFGSPDFEKMNKNSESLLYEAVRMMTTGNAANLELFTLLLEDGADLYQTSIAYGSEVSTIDLLAEKSPEFLEIALNSGQLDVDRKDDNGNTLLHKLCGRETLHEDSRAKEVYRNAKLLLAAGADANALNDNEETPMMIASNDNLKSKTVELLLSK